jgi:hypothetical protein
MMQNTFTLSFDVLEEKMTSKSTLDIATATPARWSSTAKIDRAPLRLQCIGINSIVFV